MDPITIFKLIEFGLALGVKVHAVFTKKPDGTVDADITYSQNDIKADDFTKQGIAFLESLKKTPTP